MSEEELIETLREFNEKRVENLPEPARKLFYAIMKIADERDEYKSIIERTIKYIEIIDNRNSYIDIVELRHIYKILQGEDKEC